MRAISVVEGGAFTLDEQLREPLRQAARRLQQQLATTASLLEESAGMFTIRGVIGTLALQSGVVLDVAPKIEVGEDWITSVLDLLLPPDRIDVAGDRRSGLAYRRDLAGVLAAIYDERLRRALRREGPILVMERREYELPLLKGKLNVSKWATHALWRPHQFPVAYQELTADNDFTRALAYVALALAIAAPSARVRGSLLQSARMLRPGAPEVTYAATHTALRRLPSQWGTYEPAWDIAASILSRRALLSNVGSRHGVSVAIEAWPLLERLLERAVRAAVRIARDTGSALSMPPKSGTVLLTPTTPPAGSRRHVIPDARLLRDGEHVATFEAKYARMSGNDSPPREHVFQAVTTAAAVRSPVAVLVYPDQFEPIRWNVHGFADHPSQLAAIGLGLFSYRRGEGDMARGRRLLDLLAVPAPVATDEVVVMS